jgi:hypothetical protein
MAYNVVRRLDRVQNFTFPHAIIAAESSPNAIKASGNLCSVRAFLRQAKTQAPATPLQP